MRRVVLGVLPIVKITTNQGWKLFSPVGYNTTQQRKIIMTLQLQPLDQWPQADCKHIRGVFTDIDDTLSTDGRVPASVFSAMENLRQAGFLVIPITGRPAGWCDMIARTWPVDAVVGENGALYFAHDAKNQTMIRVFAHSDSQRLENRTKLAAIREAVLSAIPGAGIASDQPYREADLAIDFCEDVAPLPMQQINQIVDIFEDFGATAKISSIHVNGWFGNYDKLSMTVRIMAELYNVDIAKEADEYVFVGDSPNDCPMFKFFPNAVGVANLRELQDQCSDLPAWITHSPRGDGFVEVARKLLGSK